MNQIQVGTFAANEHAKQLINQVLDNNRLSYGPMSKEFESRFAGMHGCVYGVLSNSGTSSLLVALEAMAEYYDWNPGDEVLVPALTFVATVNTVLQAGLKPVLVDIDDTYYQINPFKVVEAITKRTRAIIPVHTFGQPCDMTTLNNIALQFGLRIIEDSCEAMLVQHGGKFVGSWGDVGCFSTYIAHLLVTGVGGMAITRNKDLAQIMRSLVNHGIDLDELPTGMNYDNSWLSRKFRFNRIGHSFRMTELEAALGLSQLNLLAGFVAARQYNTAYLNDGLSTLSTSLQLPSQRDFTRSSCMMYPIVCLQGNRDNFAKYLNHAGIETRLMLPLVSQPAYTGLWNPNDYPVAQWIDDNGLYIGCHQDLSTQDLDYIIDTIKEFYQ